MGTPSKPPPEPIIIGRYALFEEIASGGMASVYFGRMVGAAGFSRQVAIKCLHPHLAADPSVRAMFVDEARLVARIQHPNVVPTLDVVNHGDDLLLVMEYVHGESLGRLLRRARQLGEQVPVAVTLAIVTDLLHGLHAAHEAKTEEGVPLQIVHRDVSPQNVLVGRDGAARAIDFGIAHAQVRLETTGHGLVKGKLSYMAPEQLAGDEVTRTADVFAVGVILWEMLAGKRLLGGADDERVVADILNRKFESPRTHRPGLDPALDAIVMCALERRPEARFATANEMARTLEGAGTIATATEVGEWVQHLAHETLAERARKVSAFERVRTNATGTTGPVDPVPPVSGRHRTPQGTKWAKVIVAVAALALAALVGATVHSSGTAHGAAALAH